ncbi:MAG: hypothetical protein HQK54_15995, partial [Oligoflexales bacterium]|nr:hypothetical protein [Oligoflexales bacterium]
MKATASIYLLIAAATAFFNASFAYPMDMTDVMQIKSEHDGDDVSSFVHVAQDPDQKLTIEDVASPGFSGFSKNTKKNLNFGFTRATVWLKLNVLNTTDVTRRLALKCEYPLIDSIDLYFADEKGFSKIALGREVPFSSQQIAYRGFAFPIEIMPGEQKTYYLSVRASSTMTIPLQIIEHEKLKNQIITETGILGAYFGVIGGIFLYNFFIWISTRSRAYAAYLFFLATSVAFYLAWTGMGRQYLWGDSTWWSLRSWSIPAGLLGMGTLLFEKLF